MRSTFARRWQRPVCETRTRHHESTGVYPHVERNPNHYVRTPQAHRQGPGGRQPRTRAITVSGRSPANAPVGDAPINREKWVLRIIDYYTSMHSRSTHRRYKSRSVCDTHGQVSRSLLFTSPSRCAGAWWRVGLKIDRLGERRSDVRGGGMARNGSLFL